MSRFLAPFVSLLLAVACHPCGFAGEGTTLYGSAHGQARQVSSASLATPFTPDEWEKTKDRRREQWREMLGLSPLPERTPLNATVTGTLDRGDYVVEKVHFEAIPGAYVVGNLYRPAEVEQPLPAVLYLCGHTKGKVSPTYQSHPRWFGQHGYVALVLDPIQLGESQGFHHGTHREGRWDWPSRGYTPAGTEVWNAMRALDYLESRPDVDPERMGVTGLSGGGVISWCLGAADERVKVVVPVCQSGSIEQVVTDRSTDGHCDCAFWINYDRWCWPDVGALIAPRPLLIAAGSEDVLWRPSGYRDVAHRIRKQYAALDAPDNFDLVEDLSPHGYTPQLRQAIFTWFNTHLKGDPAPVTDDVTDFVEPEENLLVFGGNLPAEDRMQQIDKLLVHQPDLPAVSDEAEWREHQQAALERLRNITFRHTVPGGVPDLREFRDDGRHRNGRSGTYVFDSLDRMTISIRTNQPDGAARADPMLCLAARPDARSTFAGGGPSRPSVSPPVRTAVVEVRNTGATSVGPGYLWTARRTYPLLGQTLPERQVSDLLAAVGLLRREAASGPVAVFGEGETAPLAIYAALLDESVSEIVIANPPASHEDPETPEFLGILRTGDLPHNLALAWPRPITFIGSLPDAYEWTHQLYEQLGSGDRIRILPNIRQWQPATSAGAAE
jgi:dienelactone hydrolase